MSGESIKFGNKRSFYKNKKLFEIEDIDIHKILVSKKLLHSKEKNSFKYFIGYNDNDVIRSLLIRLPQMIGYVKFLNKDKTMSFNATNNRLLKN